MRAGPSEVLRIYSRHIYVAVNSKMPIEGITGKEDVECNPTSEKFYTGVEKRESQGCYEYKFPTPKASEYLKLLRFRHNLWIREMLQGLLHSTLQYPKHRPGYVAYIEKFLGISLPSPEDLSSESFKEGNILPETKTEQALEIGAKNESVDEICLPEEIVDAEKFEEGSVVKIRVNRYERDPAARKACLEYYGLKCQACGFDFRENYGNVGEGFIHVHHLKPLSEIQKNYVINPVSDMRPVYPNCHAMIHRKRPPYTIEEIKNIVQEAKKKRMT